MQRRCRKNAAGAFWRRAFGSASAPKRYFALQHWVEADNPTPYFTSLFDPAITDYYCWTIPKGPLTIIGAALSPGRQAAERFALLKNLKSHVIFRPVLRKAVMRSGLQHIRIYR
jgi:hypothetical protein